MSTTTTVTRTNTIAGVSLGLAIASIFVFAGVLSLTAVICGHIGQRRAKERGLSPAAATAGTVIGYVCLALSIIAALTI